jgi:hypothetical protein
MTRGRPGVTQGKDTRGLIWVGPGGGLCGSTFASKGSAELSQHSTFRTQVRILSLVSKPVPDARRAGPGIAWKERRTAPRYAAVWVRVGGRWRRGRIIEWVRQIGRDGWDCVIMADEPVSGPPWQGRYAFDPRSIRARDTDQPPADLAGAE